VINDDSNGKILINPGTFKLPRPINSNTKFTYFGYLIADDKESAEEVFKNYIKTFCLDANADH
jgi:hypothetical protein